MISALDVAKYLLRYQDEQNPEITNQKLQKLLYYAQGLSLAIYGKPIFNENILAWSYGPVVRSVYDE